MVEQTWLAERFEAQRPQLRGVAYRMLGSLSEAEDAVQEAWLRLSRTDADTIANLGGWLTTVVGRVCLDMLRARKSRREESLDVYVPDPLVSRVADDDPEAAAVQADAVSLAVLVVLEALEPAERLAFVLHDMFAVPFEEIAPLVERSPAATRQLASRARRRVRGAEPPHDTDLAGQLAVVNAFMAAVQNGDFAALIATLDPDVTLHADTGAGWRGVAQTLHGAEMIATQAMAFARLGHTGRPAVVNGGAGAVSIVKGRVMSVMGCVIVDGKMKEIFILADPKRLSQLDVPAFGE